MAEMKSIYQVPATKDFVDLHSLHHVSPARLDFAWNNNLGYSYIKASLHYKFSPVPVEISIRIIDLFPEQQVKSDNAWSERALKKFDDAIRLPLVKHWEEYRKHMTE